MKRSWIVILTIAMMLITGLSIGGCDVKEKYMHTERSLTDKSDTLERDITRLSIQDKEQSIKNKQLKDSLNIVLSYRERVSIRENRERLKFIKDSLSLIPADTVHQSKLDSLYLVLQIEKHKIEYEKLRKSRQKDN